MENICRGPAMVKPRSDLLTRKEAAEYIMSRLKHWPSGNARSLQPPLRDGGSPSRTASPILMHGLPADRLPQAA